MMASQRLQIGSPNDAFTGLRIFTDRAIGVNIVFRVQIASGRRVPVRIQGFEHLLLVHGSPPATVCVALLPGFGNQPWTQPPSSGSSQVPNRSAVPGTVADELARSRT